jgi:aspartokinase
MGLKAFKQNDLEREEPVHSGDLTVKLGGTAMADVIERGEASEVLAGIKAINDLVREIGAKVTYVVSAPRGELKVTQELLNADALYYDDRVSEGWEAKLDQIQSYYCEHVDRLFADDQKEAVINYIKIQFHNLKYDTMSGLSKTARFDRTVQLGEELSAFILAKLIDAKQLETWNLNVWGVSGAYVNTPSKDPEVIMREHAHLLHKKAAKTKDQVLVCSGFSATTQGVGTSRALGRGYSDLTATMLAENGGTVALLKESGAILQIDPKLLPEGEVAKVIKELPIWQLLRLAEMTGDIRVVQMNALKLAAEKELTLMVADEKDPLGERGSIIRPNNVALKQDIVPMLAVSSNSESQKTTIGISPIRKENLRSFIDKVAEIFKSPEVVCVDEIAAPGHVSVKIETAQLNEGELKSCLSKLIQIVDLPSR